MFRKQLFVIVLCGALRLLHSRQISVLKDGNEGSLSCVCGTSKNVDRKAVDIFTSEDIYNAASGAENWSPVSLDKSIKDYLRDCTSCQLSYTKCSQNLNSTEDLDCVERSVEFLVSAFMKGEEPAGEPVQEGRIQGNYPRVVDVPIGASSNHLRPARRASACTFPTSMETAAIKCYIYPSHVKCTQSCAVGYTLESGIKQEMKCNVTENKWRPTGFKECQPFVDCTLTLVASGASSCSTPVLTSGPSCKVKCSNYEDKAAVPEMTYQCDVDGKWDPPLPFCVVPGSGLILAPPPAKKTHDKEKEKEK